MVILVSSLLLSSCTTFEFKPCASNSDCNASFGVGAICNLEADGTDVPKNERRYGYCSSCSTNADCQESYGNGSFCAEYTPTDTESEFSFAKNYCETTLESISRCDVSIPENIWSDWAAYKDDIIIGQMFRGQADLAEIIGAKIAFEEIQGAIAEDSNDGVSFVTVLCDYSSDIDDGQEEYDEESAIKEIASYLTDDLGANVIIGPADANAVQELSAALKDIVMELETAANELSGTDIELEELAVVISPSAKENLQQSPDNDKFIWRMVPSISNQSLALEKLIETKGGDNVGLIYSESPYANRFSADTSVLPNEPILEILENSNNFDADLTDIFAGTGDYAALDSIVVLTTNEDIIKAVLTKILELDPSDTRQFFFTDTAVNSIVFTQDIRSLVAANPDRLSQIWGTRPGLVKVLPNDETKPFDDFELAFTNEYSENFPGSSATEYLYSANNNIHAAYAYDAMWVGVLGALWAPNGLERSVSTVIAGLGKISETGPSEQEIPLSSLRWDDITEAFSQGNEINISGRSSNLDFDLESNSLNSPFEIWYIDANSNQQVSERCLFSQGAEPTVTCTETVQ